jgi:hypothetical protein
MFLETARLEREDWQEERAERKRPLAIDRVIIIEAGLGVEVECVEAEEDQEDECFV